MLGAPLSEPLKALVYYRGLTGNVEIISEIGENERQRFLMTSDACWAIVQFD